MAVRADDVNLGRDKALVELFQSGDGRAFEDLYRRYFQRVYRFCLKRVGDPHEAEEIAQEAFVRAYGAMPRFTGERRFYPWLSVIASRLCVDHHRRRSRTSPTPEVELGVVEGGQEDVIAQVDRDMLRAALDRMAPRHREVLRLREEEGWSYDQIARHLEVRVGTIEALLFRARRALRREFHALAGVEGRLVTLPVIGYLIRRLGDLRHRVADLGAQAAPILAASAVSVVAAVGTVVASGGSSSPPPGGATANGDAIPTVDMPALTAASTAAPSVVPAGNDSPSVQPATPKADPILEAGRPAGVTTREEARREAESMPVQLKAAGATVAMDPAAYLPLP